MIYLVDFRTADVGGAVSPGRLVRGPGLGSESDLRAETRVTFLIHGFNVNRSAGSAALLRLAAGLAQATAYVGVLWPGDHWVRAISYPLEGRDADDTAAMLARYVEDLLPVGAQLSFVSHSLGARVVLETAKRLNVSRYPIRQMCLLAAAVDDFSVSEKRTYLSVISKADRATVLASRRDLVLSAAYPLGDLLQAFIYFRKDTPGLALGYHGPRSCGTDKVPSQVYHEQIPDARGANHGHYFPDAPPTMNQASTVVFVGEVLAGLQDPKYR